MTFWEARLAFQVCGHYHGGRLAHRAMLPLSPARCAAAGGANAAATGRELCTRRPVATLRKADSLPYGSCFKPFLIAIEREAPFLRLFSLFPLLASS